jgi:hypothetical protein
VHLSAKGLDIIKAVINVASDNYPGEGVDVANAVLALAPAAAIASPFVVVDDGHA